jgi:hypothetical protein
MGTRTKALVGALLCAALTRTGIAAEDRSYAIVDTGQTAFYDTQSEIAEPAVGASFYGQDAQYAGAQPSYTDNGDGTVTDNVTGLMWQQGFDVLSYDDAVVSADASTLAGYSDWRIPDIKEMYSLILFSGADPSGGDEGSVPAGATPFVDTSVFDFEYGSNGERIIDTQYLTTSIYNGVTMGRDETVFGVNLADGRIKGYPMDDPRTREANALSVRLVRGAAGYGENDFADNGDGTISDSPTGLMWAQDDSGFGMNWEDALAWAQDMNAAEYIGHSDWRVPNAKELHSILDYSRSPQATNSAAIDPVFNCSEITDEGGSPNYPFYWTGTTHMKSNGQADNAVYLCFGEGLGFMLFPFNDDVELLDVHGAGAQRSDPKAGDAADYPEGHGPQGDVIRIENYVRLVRDMDATPEPGAEPEVGSAWDVNGDDKVDILDLVTVATAFGTSGADLAGDVNGDGAVNIIDLVTVASHFGETSSAVAGAPQLPRAGDSSLIAGWLEQARYANDGSKPYRRGLDVLERFLGSVPARTTRLLANYPNPFNPETWVPFELAESTDVTVTVYSSLGQVVRRLDLGRLPAGAYRTTDRAAYWNGRNDSGEAVSSGSYYVALDAGGVRETRRIVVMK